MASSTGTSCTKIVVLPSLLMSLSRMKLMPVSRDSTSNTIFVGASRNCRVTLRFSRVFSRGATAVGPRGKLLGRLETGVFSEYRSQLRLGRVIVLACEILSGRRDRDTMARVTFERREPAMSAVVGRVQRQHPTVRLCRYIDLARGPGAVRDGNQLLDGGLAAGGQVEPVSHVARIALDRGSELGDAGFVVSLIDGNE